MLHLTQIFQGDVVAVILVDILANTADAFNGHGVPSVKAHDHALVKGEQIEVFVQMADGVRHKVRTVVPPVCAAGGILQQDLEQKFTEAVMLFVRRLLAVCAVAGLAEIGKVLREVARFKLKLCHNAGGVIGGEAVHLMAGIGKDIAFMQLVVAVSVFQAERPVEHVQDLNIQVIVGRVFLDMGDGDVHGEIVRVAEPFQQHIGVLLVG